MPQRCLKTTTSGCAQQFCASSEVTTWPFWWNLIGVLLQVWIFVQSLSRIINVIYYSYEQDLQNFEGPHWAVVKLWPFWWILVGVLLQVWYFAQSLSFLSMWSIIVTDKAYKFLKSCIKLLWGYSLFGEFWLGFSYRYESSHNLLNFCQCDIL